MQQITIYKVVDVKDLPTEKGSYVAEIHKRIAGENSYYQKELWFNPLNGWHDLDENEVVEKWLKPTTYIEIEGALYESIEHYEKVHGESFDAGYATGEYDGRNLITGDKYYSKDKSDFLKQKTK